MKCSNCDNTATYIYTPSEGQRIPFCTKDLPGFLKDRAVAGLLEITDASKKEINEVINILNSPEVVVETPVESPFVEEPAAVVEETTPVKKTTKKAVVQTESE
jgi:hypothetical protein